MTAADLGLNRDFNMGRLSFADCIRHGRCVRCLRLAAYRDQRSPGAAASVDFRLRVVIYYALRSSSCSMNASTLVLVCSSEISRRSFRSPLMVRLGMPVSLLEPLGHAVAAVGIVRAGLGVVVDDAVDLEELEHVPDVVLLGLVRAHDEELRVGAGHAVEGVFGVEGREDPAVAVGGGEHVGLQRRRTAASGRAEPAPDRHAVPVDAELLVRHRALAVL